MREEYNGGRVLVMFFVFVANAAGLVGAITERSRWLAYAVVAALCAVAFGVSSERN